MKSKFQYHLKTTFQKGKHAGKTLKEVIDTDIDYVKALHTSACNDLDCSYSLSQDAFNYLMEVSNKSAGFRKVPTKFSGKRY